MRVHPRCHHVHDHRTRPAKSDGNRLRALQTRGAAIFAPDHVREDLRPGTRHGGHDGEARSLRYLEWTWDPDPNDTTYIVDFAYLLREEGRPVRIEHDRHLFGLFGREEWLRLLAEVGFQPKVLPLKHSEVEPGASEVFVGVKPRN